MSRTNSDKLAAGPTDEASVASRTRRQTRIRARDEEKQPSAPSSGSVHVSPAMRIYRHALESVFGMLELEDLAHILSVSRSWAAAVRSMAPIRAVIDRGEWALRRAKKTFVPLPPIETIVLRTYRRHPNPARRHIVDPAGKRVAWSPGATHSKPHLTLVRADTHTKRTAHPARQVNVAGPPT